MTNKYLPIIGDKLEVYDLSRSRGKAMVSQMLDIIDDKTYIISGPIENKELIPLYRNNSIEVVYYKENRGKFFFNARILQVTHKDMYKLKVKRNTRIKKIQQRDFFRLPSNITIIKKHILKEGNKERVIEEECISDNISGGGIGLLSNYSHKIGETVKVEIDADNIPLKTKGEIVRVSKSNNNEYKYNIGIQFLNMDDEERDKIIKFIFNQQRKLRKKGLI